MADAYEVVKGSLKLKGVADGGIKKKKKKNKKKKSLEETVVRMAQLKEQEARHSSGDDDAEQNNEQDNRTAAQKAFERIQEQRTADRIMKEAGKTHRQRVEKFNEYLDELTEHYDIPKVSWTK